MTWALDLATVIEDAGAAASGAVKIGTAVDVGAGDGPIIVIIPTSGMSPERTHNQRIAYERPGAQVEVHARSWEAAQAKALALISILDGIKNRMIGSTWYVVVDALQSNPIDGGLDDQNRPTAKFNVLGKKRPDGQGA